MTRILKWNVPVDDKPHYIGGGQLVHVACMGPADLVQVWTEELEDPVVDRVVTVVGTGQDYPDSTDGVWHHVGTTIAQTGYQKLVWHLIVFRENVNGYIKH